LSQKSLSLQQVVAMNEDMRQQRSQRLTLAEEEKGSAEQTIQAQKGTIKRLQQDIAVVSLHITLVQGTLLS